MKRPFSDMNPNDLGLKDLMTELSKVKESLLQSSNGDFDNVDNLIKISHIIGIRKALEIIETSPTKEDAVNRIIHHLMNTYK
ncbi:MAG: hypothetical protein V1709_11270 [Planctomycetota bacterium]